MLRQEEVLTQESYQFTTPLGHAAHTRALCVHRGATQHTLLTETYSCRALLSPSARYTEERFALCAGTRAGPYEHKRDRTRLC